MSAALQRQVGNTRVGKPLSVIVQTKLTVGAPNDPYEQEADRVASAVIGAPERKKEPTADRQQCSGCEQRLQRAQDNDLIFQYPLRGTQTGESDPYVSPEVEPQIAANRGSGQPLPNSLLERMEPQFERNFSGVRVHDDTNAWLLNQNLQARAFTTGQDIFFGRGQYDPGNIGGQDLLAHELAHVVQQNESIPAPDIQARTIRQDFATAAFETGPIWDVVLIIRAAPDGNPEGLQDFISACHDGIRGAAYSLGSARQVESRRIRVVMRYHRPALISNISQQAFRLARQSVLGEERPSATQEPPAPTTPPPTQAPPPQPEPTPAPQQEERRESLEEQARREAEQGSPQLREALRSARQSPLSFEFDRELEGATRLAVREGGGIRVVVESNFADPTAAPEDLSFLIDLMADEWGPDSSQGRVRFTAGSTGIYTWSNLSAGAYYFRFSKSSTGTLRGTVWIDVLSGSGETARTGESADQFELATGIDPQRHEVSGVAYGQYVLRSEPVTNSFIFGTLPGGPIPVRVIDKRSFDRAGENSWYKISFQDRATFERLATEIPPMQNSLAREMYDAGQAWITAGALKVYVPYQLLLSQIRAFEAQPDVASLSLGERVTLLRQLHQDPALPFDEIIGTEEGERTVENRPELSNLVQMLKGPVTGVVLPGGEHIDFAHFLITLDAYSHPDRNATYTPGFPVPEMPIGSNRAVASWSGDVGGAAGDYSVAHEDRHLTELDNALLDENFQKSAPDADLLGNLDGMGAQLMLQQNSGISSIEQLVRSYYEGITSDRPQGDPNALRSHRAQALTAFLGSYGFTHATNLSSSRSAFICILSDTLHFANIWYMNRRGFSLSTISPPLSLLTQASREMAHRFLRRIESFAAQYAVGTIPPGLTRSVSCPAPTAPEGTGTGSQPGAEQQAPPMRRKEETSTAP
jgi:hypothetical protein